MGKIQHKTVVPVGGYAGCATVDDLDMANSGNIVAVTATVSVSAAIQFNLIDIVADQHCFITLGLPGVADPILHVAYPIRANIIYRMPINPGFVIKVIGSDIGSLWYHPVKGDIDSEV